MAKIVFITLYDKGCLGVRYLSSVLKDAKHHTSIIYLGSHGGEVKKRNDTFFDEDLWVGVNEYGADLIRSYSEAISEEDIAILLSLLEKENPDIIGFSLRTMFLNTAAALTERIRSRIKAKIIYGGIAATCEPKRCLDYADMACMGDGEYSMLELANRFDKGLALDDINNIWVHNNGSLKMNPILPLQQNLDGIPFPDYEPEGKFSILKSQLVKNDPSIGNMNRFTYEIMTSRGCSFSCSYCCNDVLRRLYSGQNFLRRRSVENVINELKLAKDKHNIKSVLFKDEIFTFDFDWVKEFSRRYKGEIGLPFWCYTHPSFANEEMLRVLKGAGMFSITMGIQSGSRDILYKVFNRPTPPEKIVEVAGILEKLNLPIKPRYDIITNNPFENESDRRKTLELLMLLPKPVNFGLTKLSFIPGTRISKALEDGPLAKKADSKTYEFWNSLYLLNQYKLFPNFLISFLSNRRLIKNNPGVLKLLLFPKFLEIKFQEAIDGIKRVLPTGTILFLKRLRQAVKGY